MIRKLFRFLLAVWRLSLAWIDLRRESGLSYTAIEAIDAETQKRLTAWKNKHIPRTPHERDNWDARCAAQERIIRAAVRREKPYAH